jgi:hypothetical protein
MLGVVMMGGCKATDTDNGLALLHIVGRKSQQQTDTLHPPQRVLQHPRTAPLSPPSQGEVRSSMVRSALFL